ncbi:MAG TPA: methylated-DNA--[protein]-cysteine S-methyltransferase [Thermoanaerobaculia bacterium]|jgi:methylated-DNA-[protein]-cysteine S-methyltransferase
MTTSFNVFDTAIGACGIAWGERGVTHAWLPERDAARLRGRIARRLPDAREARPTEEIREVIDRIAAHLAGSPSDLSSVPLDLDGVPDFHRRVYAIARAIPPGETLSYGEIASRLGDPTQARAVGQALGANPIPILIPCHRVLAAQGRTGGFSAPGGVATKLRLLEIEGAAAAAIPTLFPANSR